MKPPRTFWSLGVATAVLWFGFEGAAAQIDIQVEYLDVPAAELPDFLATQRESMRPLHQRLLDEGKIFAWYDYSVRFPRSDHADYNHVVVTVFSSPAHRDERNSEIPYGRFIRHTEGAYPVAESHSSEYRTMASRYSMTNFLYVPEEEQGTFQKSLEGSFGRVLEGFVEEDTWLTWGLFMSKDLPEDARHNQVIVTRHDTFASAEGGFPLVVGEPADRQRGQPVLVKSELWRLLDIVCADETCRGWKRVEPRSAATHQP